MFNSRLRQQQKLAAEQRLEQMCEAARCMTPELGDVARARIRNGLRFVESQPASQGQTRARLASLFWRRDDGIPYRSAAAYAVLAVGMLTGVAVMFGWLWWRGLELPSVNPVGAFRPYLVAGASMRFAAPDLLAESSSILHVKDGGLLAATYREADYLTLRGPTLLRAKTKATGRTKEAVLNLDYGQVIVEHDGGRLGQLTVAAGATRVIVTGTVFSVERAPQSTGEDSVRVAVQRGSVVVAHSSGRMHVGSGQQWSSDEPRRLRPIATELSRLLTDHSTRFRPPNEAAQRTQTRRIEVLMETGTTWMENARLGDGPLWANVPAHGGQVRVLPRKPASRRKSQKHATAPPETASGTSTSDTRSKPNRVRLPPEGKRNRLPRRRSRSAGLKGAERLYQKAESALARREPIAARTALRELIARYPDHPLHVVARYELGQRAFLEGRYENALRHLDHIPTGHSLAGEGALYLRCRTLLALKRWQATSVCLERFERQFPGSSHHREVQSLKSQLDGRDR